MGWREIFVFDFSFFWRGWRRRRKTRERGDEAFALNVRAGVVLHARGSFHVRVTQASNSLNSPSPSLESLPFSSSQPYTSSQTSHGYWIPKQWGDSYAVARAEDCAATHCARTHAPTACHPLPRYLQAHALPTAARAPTRRLRLAANLPEGVHIAQLQKNGAR